MFWKIFITQLKVTLADRPTLFWALLFPLILGTLFHFAFGGLNKVDGFTAVPVAIVNDAAYKSDTALSSSIAALTSGDGAILKATNVDNKNAALVLLTDQKVDGIIESDGSHGTVTVHGVSGSFNETIIKTAVEQSVQTTSAVSAALAKDSMVGAKLGALGTNYLKDTTNENVDRTVIYFYSLIGMACLYAGYFGLYAVNRTEANLSKLGARLAVSPVSKIMALLAGTSAGLVIAIAGQLLLYTYLTQVLNVNFGAASWAILLIMLVGCVIGVAIGVLIGAASKRTENGKINLLSIGTLLCSVLAGMMGTQSLKHFIDQSAPLLAAINPVNTISDALYATYYFGIGQRYWFDITILLTFAAVMMFTAWMAVRRKTYASL